MNKYYNSLGDALTDTKTGDPVLLKQSTASSQPVYDQSGSVVGYIEMAAKDTAAFATSVQPEVMSLAEKYQKLSLPGKFMVGAVMYFAVKKMF
jgi:hypothetical protein